MISIIQSTISLLHPSFGLWVSYKFQSSLVSKDKTIGPPNHQLENKQKNNCDSGTNVTLTTNTSKRQGRSNIIGNLNAAHLTQGLGRGRVMFNERFTKGKESGAFNLNDYFSSKKSNFFFLVLAYNLYFLSKGVPSSYVKSNFQVIG